MVATRSLLLLHAVPWWALALRGVGALAFGVLALVWPGLTLAVLVGLFAAYAFVDGLTGVVTGVGARWWSMVGLGAFSVAAGVAALAWPGLTALALVYLIAAWAIARGAFELVAAVQLRREIEGEWLLALSGLASIAFGVLAAAFPGAGALSIVWLLGAFALVLGALSLAVALRLRASARARPARPAPARARDEGLLTPSGAPPRDLQ